MKTTRSDDLGDVEDMDAGVEDARVETEETECPERTTPPPPMGYSYTAVQPTPFYSPYYPLPKRSRSDEDSLSYYGSTDSGIMGIRDLVVNSNAQTQASIANLCASVQSITAELSRLNDQIRPFLRKRRSDELKQRDKDGGSKDGSECASSQEYAIFGDPHGGPREKVEVKDMTQNDLRSVERRYSDTPEGLAVALLLLLFTPDQLKHGNCTKPVRKDIDQLDPDRVWAIRWDPAPRWAALLTKTLNAKCRQLRNK
jgi:hypothetical protein